VPRKRKEVVSDSDAPKQIEISPNVTVRELAASLGVSGAEVVRQLLQNGIKANLNKTIDYDTAAVVAVDLGYEVIEKTPSEPAVEAVDVKEQLEEQDQELEIRPPVVTVMGHIDHGKTSLLDAIRQTNVIATEAGSITQHMGAYQVEVNGQKVTFLDTPGHEAFTAMRARGAQVTDIAILVVAADDGVMPQTKEAIAHARAAGVPVIVAINKIDKPNLNLEVVKQQLAEEELVIEEWGGDVMSVPISAKMNEGINELLESILIMAEMLQLKANPKCSASGVVIEAGLDKTKGPLATFLVKSGTLKPGDAVVVSNTWGKIKAMFDDAGRQVKEAAPATPVKVLGLNAVPQAGDTFTVLPNEREARALVQKQPGKQRELPKPTRAVNLDDFFAQVGEGQIKELNLIIKTDVQGSIEPIKNSLEQLETEEVKVKIINASSGGITEGDILFALASKGIIIGFNTSPVPGVQRLAESEGVDIRHYKVIYELIEDIDRAIKGMKEPQYVEVIEGHAEVRALFSSSKVGQIAGVYISDGKVSRDSQVRIIRQKEVVHQASISSLKRFKDDVKVVNTGFECGIGIEGFNQFIEGDIIEAYRKEKADESTY